jgi:hypothetical protein
MDEIRGIKRILQKIFPSFCFPHDNDPIWFILLDLLWCMKWCVKNLVSYAMCREGCDFTFCVVICDLIRCVVMKLRRAI